VTDGTTNASVPKGLNPESVTFEQATELLEARRNAAPSPRRGAAPGGRRRAAAAAPRARKTTRKAAGA
jgi:DNA topoisomerase-1